MRVPTLDDLRTIELLHDGGFDLPDLSNREYTHVEVTDGGRSAAFVKLTSEVTMVLDPALTNYQKAALTKQHFLSIRDRLPTSDTHVFILKDGIRFAYLLEKHLGFSKAAGTAMYWRRRKNGETAD